MVGLERTYTLLWVDYWRAVEHWTSVCVVWQRSIADGLAVAGGLSEPGIEAGNIVRLHSGRL